MVHVRAYALLAALGFGMFAAGCSGGSSGVTPPINPSGSQKIESTIPESTVRTDASSAYVIRGSIVALKGSNGFQMEGGPGIGYVNIYPTSSTTLTYNGLEPKVGYYAVVDALTDQGGSPTAIALYTSESASTGGTGSSGSSAPEGKKISGPIVALKGSNGFQMEGGPGIGYVNVYPTSSTTLAYNGLEPKVGLYATVYAATTQGSEPNWIGLAASSTGSTPSPAPTSPSSSVPTHVLTAALVYGYGGTSTSVPLSEIAPYVSWAQTSEEYSHELRSAGVKVDVYANFWRNYTSDSPLIGYTDLKPGGAHAAAEAKNCSGSVLYDSSYGGGYEADARSGSALGHAQVLADYRLAEYTGGYDALFSDDTASVTMNGGQNPCDYSQSSYDQATNTVDTDLKVPIFINALGAAANPASKTDLLDPSNVIGAMCEECYGTKGSSGDVVQGGSFWQDIENAEIDLAGRHKIFWDYARDDGSASGETAIRTYVYASFLLGYSPQYAMLQEAFATSHGLEIMPETGLVPEDPVTTESSVSGYERSGGTYMREFADCYYRGVNKGRCAVVVNPNSGSASVPTSAYAHSMVLSGSGVIDGGSVSFSGGRITSLAGLHAAILFE